MIDLSLKVGSNNGTQSEYKYSYSSKQSWSLPYLKGLLAVSTALPLVEKPWKLNDYVELWELQIFRMEVEANEIKRERLNGLR